MCVWVLSLDIVAGSYQATIQCPLGCGCIQVCECACVRVCNVRACVCVMCMHVCAGLK